jgi:hypothetical protein
VTIGPQLILSDSLVHAIARLVDDAGATREPSHYDITEVFRRADLLAGDPHSDPLGTKVGKRKRVTQTLIWALDANQVAGVSGLVGLLGSVRGCGGFRPESGNFCGVDAISNCVAAFADQPTELTLDGQLRPRNLAALAGRELTDALLSYVVRAQRGHLDSVLVTGTDKDLIEATAAHVLEERFNVTASPTTDFPTLLGQAFIAVGLVPHSPKQERPGLDGARDALSSSLHVLGCAVNRFRNKAGSGHGRPFLPNLTAGEVAALTESAGLVSAALLDALAAHS